MSDQFATYVDSETAERWEKEAEKMGMTKSAWLQAMVEAGLKKFTRNGQSTNTCNELRQQRDDLRKELQRARDRIETLEKQLHRSDRQAIIEYVQNHPGVKYRDIVQHIVNTANGRVTKLLDQLEEDELEIDEQGRIYHN